MRKYIFSVSLNKVLDYKKKFLKYLTLKLKKKKIFLSVRRLEKVSKF
jgi:hypothetical protein